MTFSNDNVTGHSISAEGQDSINKFKISGQVDKFTK